MIAFLLRITGLSRLALSGLAVAVLVAVILLAVWRCDTKADKAATQQRERGRIEERGQTTADTLKQAEKASQAVAETKADDAARIAACQRHSRTPENCR